MTKSDISLFRKLSDPKQTDQVKLQEYVAKDDHHTAEKTSSSHRHHRSDRHHRKHHRSDKNHEPEPNPMDEPEDWQQERSLVARDVDAEILAEKQSCLEAIKHYTTNPVGPNYTASTQFTMEDDLGAMQFECDRFKTRENCESTVGMARMG